MFKLIDLPYKSLAPVISDETLSFHHGKHLQAYVDNLNKLIAGTELEGKSLEEIIRNSGLAPESRGVFNNAGQILNHELYFTQFKTPDQDGGDGASLPAPTTPSCPTPIGHLKHQIEKQWGSFEAFQSEFEAKGISLFGSGWVWLQTNAEGELSIAQYAGADNPIAHVIPGQTGHLRPLLTFDVWEHAYYLDYQNRRAAHLKELWKIVDWEVIEKRFTK